MLKDILKGAGSDAMKYFPVRFVPALTSLVTVPLFTRMIGRADYGDFYLITSATSFAATLATAWITGSVVRFYWVYEKQDRLDDYVSTTFWTAVFSLASIAALLAAGTYLFGDRALPGNAIRLVPIGLAMLGANYLVNVLLQVLRASNRAGTFSVVSVGSTLLGTAVAVFLVGFVRMGAYGILLGMVIGYVTLLPVAVRAIAREGSVSPSRVDRGVLSDFVSYGFPMIPAAISSWFLVLSDRYIIGFLRGTAEVGLYSVAYGLGDKIMQLVMMPALITMGPIMVRTFEKQGQRLAQRVQTQFTRYFAMATFPLLFGLAGIAEDFMGVFTGEAYRAAYPILPIVASGVMAYGLVQIAANGVALHKKSTIIMSNTLAAAAFNIGANLLLVPRFGYMAAAYTTVASYVLLLGLTWTRSRPYMSWQIPWSDIGRIGLAGAAMWGTISLLASVLPNTPATLLAEGLAGTAVYAVALLALKELRPDERAYAIEILAKIRSRLRPGRAA